MGLTEEQFGTSSEVLEYESLIPGRIVGALVSIGAVAILVGCLDYNWIGQDYLNTTWSEVAYGWWKPLLPTMPILVLVVLSILSACAVFLGMRWRRIIWIGIAVAGLIGLYPFYRLLNPGDIPLANFVPEEQSAGLWLTSVSVAGHAAPGFYIALGGALLLIVCALSGVIGRGNGRGVARRLEQ